MIVQWLYYDYNLYYDLHYDLYNDFYHDYFIFILYLYYGYTMM